MTTLVIKRDGTKIPFTDVLIANAVYHATVDTGTPDKVLSIRVMKKVEGVVNHADSKEISVNDIQDIVEAELMSVNKEVARAYIDYRTRRDVKHV